MLPASIAVPPSIYILRDFTDGHHVSSQIQVLGSLSYSHASIFWQACGLSLDSTSQHSPRCYRASGSPHARYYGHAQHMFLHFCHCYSLLTVPINQETLFCFATFLADAKGLQHETILRYLYRVKALHINMGLSDPLEGTHWLHKGLQATHIQSNPASHKLAFTYEMLVLTCSLYSESYGLP